MCVCVCVCVCVYICMYICICMASFKVLNQQISKHIF